MKYSTEYYETEVEAQREGERCEAFMGLGYNYRFKVYYDSRLDKWALDASWWSSCD
jgi:hypothetical protein